MFSDKIDSYLSTKRVTSSLLKLSCIHLENSIAFTYESCLFFMNIIIKTIIVISYLTCSITEKIRILVIIAVT